MGNAARGGNVANQQCSSIKLQSKRPASGRQQHPACELSCSSPTCSVSTMQSLLASRSRALSALSSLVVHCTEHPLLCRTMNPAAAGRSEPDCWAWQVGVQHGAHESSAERCPSTLC